MGVQGVSVSVCGVTEEMEEADDGEEVMVEDEVAVEQTGREAGKEGGRKRRRQPPLRGHPGA